MFSCGRRRVIEEVLTWCAELRIPMVTLWWLSTENLGRHPEEVNAVLEVIEEKMTEWVQGGLTLELLPTSRHPGADSRRGGEIPLPVYKEVGFLAGRAADPGVILDHLPGEVGASRREALTKECARPGK